MTDLQERLKEAGFEIWERPFNDEDPDGPTVLSLTIDIGAEDLVPVGASADEHDDILRSLAAMIPGTFEHWAGLLAAAVEG